MTHIDVRSCLRWFQQRANWKDLKILRHYDPRIAEWWKTDGITPAQIFHTKKIIYAIEQTKRNDPRPKIAATSCPLYYINLFIGLVDQYVYLCISQYLNYFGYLKVPVCIYELYYDNIKYLDDINHNDLVFAVGTEREIIIEDYHICPYMMPKLEEFLTVIGESFYGATKGCNVLEIYRLSEIKEIRSHAYQQTLNDCIEQFPKELKDNFPVELTDLILSYI